MNKKGHVERMVDASWGCRGRTLAAPRCGDVRRGLSGVPKNAPFRDHHNSFTGHVCPMRSFLVRQDAKKRDRGVWIVDGFLQSFKGCQLTPSSYLSLFSSVVLRRLFVLHVLFLLKDSSFCRQTVSCQRCALYSPF